MKINEALERYKGNKTILELVRELDAESYKKSGVERQVPAGMQRVDLDSRPVGKNGAIFKNYDYGEALAKKKQKRETSTHVQTRDVGSNKVIFPNYDLYGPDEGSETSPGTGLYGDMGEKKKKYKSVGEFRKKKDEARKKRKKALAKLYERVDSKKKVIKLAVIRDNIQDRCPFGLDIPVACKEVGKGVLKMTPLKDPTDPKNIKDVKNNRKLFKPTGEKCPFAREVFEDAVQCDLDIDTSDSAPVGSPYYYRHFNHETSLDGLYSYPHSSGSLGYYSDTAIPTNNYYGPYSIESISSKDEKRKK